MTPNGKRLVKHLLVFCENLDHAEGKRRDEKSISSKKYRMSFEEFEEKNMVKEKGGSWEVEKDAMDWEHAVEGIRHLQEKINKIKESGDGD